jgi:hypothetical protein
MMLHAYAFHAAVIPWLQEAVMLQQMQEVSDSMRAITAAHAARAALLSFGPGSTDEVGNLQT